MASNNIEPKLTALAPVVLSAFRIVFGLLLTMHGTSKLFAWPIPPGPKGAVPTGAWPFWYAGVIEVILGLLIVAGLFTRIAAFFASGEMAFAYFTQHLPNGLWPIANSGELAVMNCFAFFLLVFTGGGAIAVDGLLKRRHETPALTN